MSNIYKPDVSNIFSMLKPTLFLKLENGEEFDIKDKIPQLEFLGDTYTPAKTNTMQEFAGVDGSLFNYSSIGKNTVTLKFLLHYRDYYELKALRHEVYGLLMQKTIYRVRTDAEPLLVKYCYSTGFDIEPKKNGANGALVTVTMDNPSGYLFSMNTSDKQQDIWDEYPLGWHLPIFDSKAFTFNKQNFQVYNPSLKEIDPYYNKDSLKILIKFTGGSLSLFNSTNGSSYTYNEKSNGYDSILVDGLTTYVNNKVATNKTDYNNLVLAEGWNNISVNGATKIDITFSFPFVYL